MASSYSRDCELVRYSTAARASLTLIDGFAQVFRNVVGDEERFVFAVRSLVVADLRTALALGPKSLALALRLFATTADAACRMFWVER